MTLQRGQGRVLGAFFSGTGGNVEASPRIRITPVSVTEVFSEFAGFNGANTNIVLHLGHRTVFPAKLMSPRTWCPRGQESVILLLEVFSCMFLARFDFTAVL